MRCVAVIAATLAALGLLSGCRQALWPHDAPRSQFETYDRMHNRYVPIEEPDVFGHPRPALRARLSNSR